MGVKGLTVNGGSLRRLVTALAIASALAAAACSGGGGGKSGTPTPLDTTPTSVPHVDPTIDGSTFFFPGRGYAAVIPDGWHANPNSLLAGPQLVDTFFSPDTVDGVQSNISVTCELNPSNVTTQEFYDTRVATLGKLGAGDVKVLGGSTVAGVAAQGIAYALTRDKITIAKVDLMFATPRCAWTVALASAPSAAGTNTALFDQFLQSFKLLADAATPQPGT
jgi:hypothetical protein